MLQETMVQGARATPCIQETMLPRDYAPRCYRVTPCIQESVSKSLYPRVYIQDYAPKRLCCYQVLCCSVIHAIRYRATPCTQETMLPGDIAYRFHAALEPCFLGLHDSATPCTQETMLHQEILLPRDYATLLPESDALAESGRSPDSAGCWLFRV